MFAGQFAECAGGCFDQVHRDCGPGKNRLEHQEQDQCQQNRANDRMQHDTVDAVAGRMRDDIVESEPLQDLADRDVIALFAGASFFRWVCRRCCPPDGLVVEAFDQ